VESIPDASQNSQMANVTAFAQSLQTQICDGLKTDQKIMFPFHFWIEESKSSVQQIEFVTKDQMDDQELRGRRLGAESEDIERQSFNRTNIELFHWESLKTGDQICER
jgi:hypothetical protein